MKRQHAAFLYICTISLVLTAVVGRVWSASRISQSNDAGRAGQVTFDTGAIGSFIQGDAPAVRLALDGRLWFDMYLRVLVWDLRKARPTLAFSQKITSATRSNNTCLLPRNKFNSLSPGNYQLEVELCQTTYPGIRVVSQIEQMFTVVTTPPPPPLIVPELQSLSTTSASQEPTTPANDTSVVIDQPLQSTATKQEVWNLIPQAGQTYSNLILRGGVRAVWQTIDNVTFIDCDFRDAGVLLTVQARDDGSDACHNWKFIRCSFVGATRSDWGHSHGAFLQGADNFVFTNCVFSFNGWLDGARFNQNHNIYLLNVGNLTFSGCAFHRAAAQGIKGLGYRRLEVNGCVFSGNLIDIGSDDRLASGVLIVRNCRFYNVGGQDSVGNTLGWSLALEHYNNPLNYVLIQNCKWYGPAVSTNAWTVKLAGNGVQSASISDCDLTEWHINTQTWPKIVNYIGTRLTMTNIVGLE